MTSMVIEWIELHSLISACFKYVAIQSQAGMDYLPWASIHSADGRLTIRSHEV